MNLQLQGLHHVSALSADIARNHAFYTGVLGLRLVKKTVNQDAPGMYHLFYADGTGRPGTEVTFFDFPRAARAHRGTNAITRTTLRVTGTPALQYWRARLQEHDLETALTVRDGRAHLDFEDVDGTCLAFIDDGGKGPRGAMNTHSGVLEAYQIQGLGFSEFTVSSLNSTRDFLTQGLNMSPARQYEHAGQLYHVYEMGQADQGGPHAELHVTERPDLPPAKPGAGGVHHVALRMKDTAELVSWLARLQAAGYGNSGLVDRHYFQSVYIRDPNGLVVELATDGPGFTTDEPLHTLGEKLSLPPFLEPRRATIEAHLRPLNLSTQKALNLRSELR